jgi:hypothetical protein
MAYLAEITADWTEEERAQFALLLKRFTHAAVQAPMDTDGIGKIFEEAEAADEGVSRRPTTTAGRRRLGAAQQDIDLRGMP